MLESAYDECFAVELAARGLTVERQKALPVIYKNQRVDCGYRLDFIIERSVIVEVEAVERLERVHSVQLLSYLRFASRAGLRSRLAVESHFELCDLCVLCA